MKNNGFGLIEILLVIVIIALIFILPKGFTTLPSNTLVEENNSKKNTFLIEVKNVYKKVEETYISSKLNNKPIYRINSEDDSKLAMSGKSLKYCIILNNDGQILFFNASNGKYNIEIDKNQSFEDLKRENVKEGSLDDFDCKSIPVTLD